MRREKLFIYAMVTSIILMIVLTLALTASAANEMTVWTDHATVKIRPKSPAKADQTSAVLKAGKNEFESFQLVVTASSTPLSGVDVAVSDLTDAHGNVLPAGSIMIYKEVYMSVGTPSTIQGGTGEWPDALIPKKDEYVGEVRNAFPFSVGAGRNQPVWIEVYVPPTAASGVYTGTATVTAEGQSPVIVPIELTVWNFQLPSTSTIKSAYSIDYHLLPKGHRIASALPLDLIELYAKASLLHRITGSYLPAPQSMGGMSGAGPNWGPFDATFGPYLDGTVILPGGKLPGSKMTTYQMSNYQHETDVPFLRSISEHLKAKGWFDRLFEYTCDEPRPEPTNACSFNDIKAKANALHQADPEMRTLVTTSIQRAQKNGVAGLIDLLTPTIRFIDDKPMRSEVGGEPGQVEDSILAGNQRSKYGAELWWYQACGSHGCGIMGGGPSDPNGYHTDWPAYMIDLPSMFNRIMEWETYKYNIQGQLYYDMVYAYGQKDPWSTQFYFGGNGDGTLFYPGRPNKIGGTKHIPIESIRLKLIREGQEDYEYMHLLQTLGEGAFADEQVARIVTNTYTWNREPLDLYSAREKMAGRILMHTAPSEVSLADSGPLDSSGNPSIDGAGITAGPGGNTLPGGGGGGGGCALLSMQERTDWKQAIPYLVVFFSPFTGRLLKKPARRRS
ncbi:MAG TPA: glycoside hydrolase domain-containing protein [Candidatus Manganitrophaceae bacterium]|nr:glycoside hydrolase domain-containing protein [Candidatus Manganitrophaceae bacterium]